MSPQPVGPDEVRNEVGHVLASPVFSGSPTLHRLLVYLVEETLADGGAHLKEYTVGQRVFRRGPDFNPQIDSIVRVQMSVLRKKLATYYEQCGAGDRVRIEIPRGRYEPCFVIQSASRGEKSARPAAGSGSHGLAPAGSGRWVYLTAGVLIGVVVVLGVLRWGPRAAAESGVAGAHSSISEWRDHPLWRGFFDCPANTRLIVGAPFMFFVEPGILARDVAVNDSRDMASSQWLRDLSAKSGHKAVPTELYTGLGEAAGINLLTRFFRGSGQDLPVIRNRLATWSDFAAGNIIVLSSLRFRTLRQKLERPTEFEFRTVPGARPLLRNLHPAPGEALEYVPGNHIDYALVTVWPGTLAGRRIMAVGGSETWGTEGGVVYITDPDSLRQLRGKLADTKGHGPSSASLQVLIKVSINDGQVVSAEYVTHHWLN